MDVVLNKLVSTCPRTRKQAAQCFAFYICIFSFFVQNTVNRILVPVITDYSFLINIVEYQRKARKIGREPENIADTSFRISLVRIRESVGKNLVSTIGIHFSSLYRLPNHIHSDNFISNGQTVH